MGAERGSFRVMPAWRSSTTSLPQTSTDGPEPRWLGLFCLQCLPSRLPLTAWSVVHSYVGTGRIQEMEVPQHVRYSSSHGGPTRIMRDERVAEAIGLVGTDRAGLRSTLASWRAWPGNHRSTREC